MSIHWLGMGKQFQLDLYVKILHVIHMTLNNCIVFSEAKTPYEHKYNMLNMVFHSIRKLIGTTHEQNKSFSIDQQLLYI